PSRNGVSTESGWSTSWPADGPPVAWKRNVGRGHSAVAVVGRRVYTMGNADGKDTVFCLDAKTGEKIWTHSYPCKPGKYPGSHSTPTVDGPRVYTYSREGLLLCLTADKGDVVWSRNLKAEFKSKGPRWDFACSPLVVGGKIIVEVGAKDAAVVALAKADGKVRWTWQHRPNGTNTETRYFANGRISLLAQWRRGRLASVKRFGPDGRQLPPPNIAERWSLRQALQVGHLAYGDRWYTYRKIPAELIGAEYIRPANASLSNRADPLAAFTLRAAADVYVAHDPGGQAGKWFKAWRAAGKLQANTPLDLYVKRFAAGATVRLGPLPRGRSMYLVIVKPVDPSAKGVISELKVHDGAAMRPVAE
ncbi:hypothetical protein LCGC14_2359960, partial [marine sediment metagenome]